MLIDLRVDDLADQREGQAIRGEHGRIPPLHDSSFGIFVNADFPDTMQWGIGFVNTHYNVSEYLRRWP